jgi:hypothetical protein
MVNILYAFLNPKDEIIDLLKAATATIKVTTRQNAIQRRGKSRNDVIRKMEIAKEEYPYEQV